MIKIDKTRDNLFDELGITRLKESYMRPEETSPQERFAYVSQKFGSNPEHAQRLYDYSSKHWLSYATPVLSYGKTKSGLPISCYLPYLHDSREGLVDTLSETNWLSMLGGGVGIGFDIRSADELSVGIMPHLKIYDAATLAYKQGTSRRGSFATYLNIDHPDIEMFIDMRKATGDPRMRAPNIHHGINVTDDFMRIIENSMKYKDYDDSWQLKDPNGKVKNTISAKQLWQKIMTTRIDTGEPYLHFIDTANKGLPYWLKDRGLKIQQSNLCVSGDTIITILDENENIIDVKMSELGNYMNKSMIKVYSYDITTNKLEFKPVTHFSLTNPKAKVMKITMENANYIICTPEHKIYTTNRGYVMAKELLETDKLFCVFKENLYNENIKIKNSKIEYLDEEISVYDITVEGNHNFFGNGILLHNCSEIELPTNKDRTAVCCLSSVGLEYFDEWKNNELFIMDIMEMLDNVLQTFIDDAPQSISRAIYSATRERSVGLGALGFHAYLQKNNIAFESLAAININNLMFKHIREKCDIANKKLGTERGEAPDAEGTGNRLSHVMSVAPNASTSIIMGNTSPSIEPFSANAYRQDTLSGAGLNKNKFLNKILVKKCAELNLDIEDMWRNIASNNGSVQHLSFLTKHQKNVFKTAMEIDQNWIILLAAMRQKYIDQGQSINIFLPPNVKIPKLHNTHFLAWKFGIKSLYYCRSEKLKRADNLSEQIERNVIEEIPELQMNSDDNECIQCEG